MNALLFVVPVLLSAAASAVPVHNDTPQSSRWREGRLNLEGTALAYVERGQGETVVFVHGAFADHRAWLPVAEAIAEDHRVVSYSRRGHEPGRVDRHALGTWAAQAKDLVLMLQAVDGAGVHVVGDGDGAVIALLAARERPHLVRSLTLVEPGLDRLIRDPSRRKAALRDRATALAASRSALASGDAEGSLRAALSGLAADPGIEGRLPEPVRAMLLDHASLLPEAEYGETPGCEALWRVRAPTLLVAETLPDPETGAYGDGDLVSIGSHRLAFSADALRHCLKFAERAQVPGTSALPHLTSPAATARIVRQFIERNARTRLAAE